MTTGDPADLPWLSVILPTHDGARWLARTLESLVAQTDQDFECILIDSSTSDETLVVARAFADRLRLRIDYRPDLRDWQGKTNLGVELARAPHVGMLHQDDTWEPHRAASVRAWLAAAPGVAVHLHPCWIVDERDRRLGRWRCPLPATPTVPEPLFLQRLIVQNFVAICAPVIARDAFLAVGGLDRGLWYTADWDLWLKLGRRGPVAYHRELLANYRIHAGALTLAGSRRAEDFEAQMTIVLDRHLAASGGERVAARARASIAVNTALAGMFHNRKSTAFGVAGKVVALGPLGLVTFLRDTRLLDRLLPRLRLHLAGRLAA